MKQLFRMCQFLCVILLLGSCMNLQEPEEGENFYLKNRSVFMKSADKLEAAFLQVLSDQTGDLEKSTWISSEASDRFDDFLEEIPYFGADNSHLDDLINAAYCLQIAELLEEEGYSHNEIGEVIYLSAGVFTSQNINKPTAWMIRTFFMTGDKIERRIKDKGTSTYQGDWEKEYVSGEDQDFDFGVNFTQCGITTMFRQQGREDLIPFICLCDYAIFKQMGIEMRRTQTIGNGAGSCDFRYYIEDPNPVDGWPPEKLPEYISSDVVTLYRKEDLVKKITNCGGHICVGCGACS